eukprot:CAMPEP_0174264950 /NCGR_PEP_ID=MMETSP0439-20130205/24613_1 /TAXON_ID=0 /ORGANISM="Stereomyxa ramosa, Strain Chinc5" /LENGTH=464 /DNA_ID=CAMNT_0015351127 /DNA_START=44 /DNA_END=1438 /DNA_ORIENTATION=-
MEAQVHQLFSKLSQLLQSGSTDEIDDECADLTRQIERNPDICKNLQEDNFSEIVKNGLRHPNANVQQLSLFFLQMSVSDNELLHLIISKEFIPDIIACIGSEELRVSVLATKLIVNIAMKPQAQPHLFEKDAMNTYNQLLKQEVVKFRVLHLFVQISKISIELFHKCSPFFDIIINDEFKSDDILEKLNVIELLKQILSSPMGAKYLDSKGVIHELSSLLSSQDQLTASFIRTPILSLLIDVCGSADDETTELLFKYPFLDAIKNILENDSSCTEAAVTSIGVIGKGEAGLTLLLQDKDLLMSWLHFYAHNDPDLKLSFFHSYAVLLGCKNQELTEAVFNLLEQKKIHSRAHIEHLLWITEQPFPEIRYSVYHVLKSLCSCTWGLQKLFSYPGFFEWLTDRSTDEEKRGIEWKYSIIEAVVKRGKENCEGIIPSYQYEALVQYLKNGVFYAKAESTVKMSSKTG